MPSATISPPTKDTWIDQNAIGTNYGANATMVLGRQADGDMQCPVMQFSLAQIPPGSQITKATLQVYQTINSGFVVRGARILSGNSDWAEATCDWVDKYGVVDWVGAGDGCHELGVDIASALMVNMTCPAGLNQYIDITLDPTEFQSMLDVGNYGFKLWIYPWQQVGFGETSTWQTKEGANVPRLVVEYDLPSIRLTRYHTDVWDHEFKIYDSMGRIVLPDEIEENEWIRLIGAGRPGSKVYDNLIADPMVSYIENVSFRMNDNKAKIRGSKESMLNAFLKRLGGVAG